jgi:predicted transposase YdaD
VWRDDPNKISGIRLRMTTPFDATLKHLLSHYGKDWIRSFGLPAAEEIETVDTDLSTVSPRADKVLYVKRPTAWIFHPELQAGWDEALLRRVFKYNALLTEAFWDVPVLSVIFLLKKKADQPVLTGTMERLEPGGESILNFRYRVVRVWELSAQELLGAGVGTLPLAPLANVAEAELPELVRRMGQRFDQEVPADEAAALWTSTYILMGLRYPNELAHELLKGVMAMKESTTYQAIIAEGLAQGLAKGRIDEARQFLLRMGRKQLGAPDEAVLARLNSINDPAQLEALGERLFDISSWVELFPTN